MTLIDTTDQPDAAMVEAAARLWAEVALGVDKPGGAPRRSAARASEVLAGS